jgi:hypothetical protein
MTESENKVVVCIAPVLYQFVLVQFTKPNILEVQEASMSSAIILLQH